MNKPVFFVLLSALVWVGISKGIDLYETHVPMGKIGQCYHLNRDGFDFKAKIVGLENDYARLNLYEYGSGFYVAMDFLSMRHSEPKEVDCD